MVTERDLTLNGKHTMQYTVKIVHLIHIILLTNVSSINIIKQTNKRILLDQ